MAELPDPVAAGCARRPMMKPFTCVQRRTCDRPYNNHQGGGMTQQKTQNQNSTSHHFQGVEECRSLIALSQLLP